MDNEEKENVMRNSLRIAVVSLAVMFVLPAWSQSAEHNHNHGADEGEVSVPPNEPGQDAFAAIAEIVTILSADPKTDWSRVDIQALRDHLVDMNDLIRAVEPVLHYIPGGVEIRISNSGTDRGAAMRMVPKHAPVLAAETGWNSVADDDGNEIVWRITSTSDEVKIRALGFFGLMAIGDHHRKHHLALARGNPMH